MCPLAVRRALIAMVLTGGIHIAGAQDPAPSATALVLAARAFDRGNQLDSARRTYEAAAVALPIVADWLRLRAAGVTTDSVARARDYALISQPVARSRIAWTDAEARERSGDFRGAARAFAALGARTDALRDSVYAVATAGDTVALQALRVSLLNTVATHPGTGDARIAVELVDRLFAPLPPADELAVARSAASGGPSSRAVTGFERVVAVRTLDSLSADDRFLYGNALARVRRDLDAARVLGTLTGRGGRNLPPALRHAALYAQGRALILGGDKTHGRQVLRTVLREAPRDTVSAHALMLLADLATDAHDDAAARRAYLGLATHFPTNVAAPHARFEAALIAFLGGSWSTAAHEWDLVAKRYPHSDEAIPADYWSGRAWARARHPTDAARRWRLVEAADPLSYYSLLSGRRLARDGPLGAVTTDTTVASLSPVADSALKRTAVLEELGMPVEGRFEAEQLVRDAGSSVPTLLGIGAGLVEAGEPGRAIAVGTRLLERGDSAWRDRRVLRLVYPLVYGDTLVHDAEAHHLDPALMAAVIRQESGFDRHAVSVVGARGLMQLMPTVGQSLAQARALGPWDVELLERAEVNLGLGMAHFATFLAQEHGDLIRALAAYNAGPSRVTLWSARKGVADPEVFIERIPFVETRDYVRAILRGREVYHVVYGLGNGNSAEPQGR